MGHPLKNTLHHTTRRKSLNRFLSPDQSHQLESRLLLAANPFNGLYAGTFGFFGYDGQADLAMVIRSIVMDADGASVGAGGGITALSIPDEEYAEMRLKAKAPLAALRLSAG